MKKALLAALLSVAVIPAFAQQAVGGIAGSQSGAGSVAATGVFGTGAAVQGTTNNSTGNASVVSVAGSGATPNVAGGAAGVHTNANTTTTSLSVGATTGNSFGLTGGVAGSQSGAAGFGGFLRF